MNKYLKLIPAKAFYAFYFVSFLTVSMLWLFKEDAAIRPLEDADAEMMFSDSAMAVADSSGPVRAPASADTIYIKSEPQVVVLSEPKSGWSLTNEIITSAIGIANLLLVVVQIRNKKGS